MRDDWLAIGLDLSLSNTGVAVLQASDQAVVHLESICTTPQDGGRIERDDFIADRIGEIVKEFGPHLIVIEEYAFSRPTMVSALGELGGLVKRELWRVTGIPECWMTITSTACKKYITGSAAPKGGKERMVAAAQPFIRQFHQHHIIDPAWYKDDNIADAIGLARMGIDHFGEAVAASVT
jgi:Holliday junction resolvasome RuvABC endonuclease subunit